MSDPGQPLDSELAQQQIGFAIKDLYRIEKLERVESAYYAFRAVEISSGRPVMAYQVLPQIAQRKGYLDRFQSDVRKLQRLRAHPAFPEVLDFCNAAPHQCYLITSYPAVNDVPLSQQLDRGMALPKALHNLGLLADALDAAHREGLVHYHLSPSHILLSDSATGERTLRVLGFGLLQQGSDALSSRPPNEYLAPEQLRNEPTDARTDQFVLAAIAYEMISGRKAFAQRGDTQAQIRERILREDPLPIPLSDAREGSINSALNKAFSKARQQRHATVRELCIELGMLVDRQQQPTQPSRPGPQSGPHRNGRLIAAALAVLCACIMAAVVLYAHRRSRTQRTGVERRLPQKSEPADLAVVPELHQDAAAPVDMTADLSALHPHRQAPDGGTARTEIVKRPQPNTAEPAARPPAVTPPAVKPPVSEQYGFRYTPDVATAKRMKLEQCLRVFGNQFEVELTLLSGKYRVSSTSDSALQKSNSLRSCLDANFAPGALPDPLTIRKERRGR